jgi:hypothetical protein
LGCKPPARSLSIPNHLCNMVLPNTSRQKGLAMSQAASPLNILGGLSLSKVAYCAIAAICYGITARL